MLKVGRLRGLHKQHCITTSRGSAYKTVAIAIFAMVSSTVSADETGALRQELHMERQKLAEQMQQLEQQMADYQQQVRRLDELEKRLGAADGAGDSMPGETVVGAETIDTPSTTPAEATQTDCNSVSFITFSRSGVRYLKP